MAKAKKQFKYTEEEMNAMRIQALLQGIDPSTIQNEEITVEKEKKPAKKRVPKVKDKVIGSENQVFTTTQKFVPELECYEKLKPSIPLMVSYHEHDIHYKDQFWNIPQRSVRYEVELVKQPKVAKDIAFMITKNDTEVERAAEGIVRYYKVVSYESILHKIKEIAYVRVEYKNGKFKTDTFVKANLLKESNANPDKVRSNLEKLVAGSLIA